MNLVKKILIGSFLTGAMFFPGCKEINVNIDEQDRGTVIGQVVWQSHDEDGTINTNTVYNPNVRLTNQESILLDTPYRTTGTDDGQFLIEVPAGSYNIHVCGFYGPKYGARTLYGKKGVIVERGETTDARQIITKSIDLGNDKGIMNLCN